MNCAEGLNIMTAHPVGSPSRAGFVDLSASSSSFRARAVLSALITFLALAGSVRAQITPTVTPVVTWSNGNYTWTYDVTLDALGTVTAKVPGGTCGGGARSAICTGTFFTIYDFTGYIAGSAKAPAGWRVSVQPAGAAIQHLTFYYRGPDIPGPADLGNFSVKSSSGGSASGLFSYQALKNGSGADSGTGATQVPAAISLSPNVKKAQPPNCALTLKKSASVTSYSAAGTPITYSYNVTDTGVALTGVSVTDPHVGLSPISCPSASLAPGASQTCTAAYTTTQADVDSGSISNTGTASGTPPTGPAVTATSSLTIPASDSPALSVVKTASVVNYLAPGTAITYSYKITNTGNVDLTSVSVTDPQAGLSAISCPSASLAPAAARHNLVQR
jgi:uncharacterized repeat protein (TIGR01451 family)